MKFLTNLNLNKNEIQNVVVQNLATAPGTPKAGQIYFDTAETKLMVYDGTSWVDATSLGIIYSFGTGLTENTETNVVSLDIATSTDLGGVKIGTNINVDANGVISVNSGSTSQKGLVEIATDAEVTTGTSETLVTNVKQLATRLLIAQGGANASKFVKTDASGNINTFSTLQTGDIPDLSGTYIPVSQKGAVNGVATLGADGLVPSTQLPSYVDDIIDLLTLSGTAPATATTGDKYYNTTSKLIFTATSTNTWGGTGATPEAGKIYVAIDTNLSYRWSGSDLVEISSATIHKYTGTVTGNDSTTSFTITHGLNTRDVLVNVYTNASPYDDVFVDIERTSTTAIAVKFAVAPATGTNYKVVIIAQGVK